MSPAKSIHEFCAEWKFSVLLAVLMLLNALRIATATAIHSRFAIDLLGTAFLLVATLSLCIEKKSRVIALTLGVPAVVLSLVGNLMSIQTESNVLLIGRAISVFFLLYMIGIVLQTLLTQPTVTRDSLAGAFCGYLLIGVMFAEGYCLADGLHPNSFQINSANPDWQDDPLRRWFTLQYFSFTTLTTLGFGDIVPVAPLTRGLALWEAVCGQFYLAVLVAGLVNLRGSK